MTQPDKHLSSAQPRHRDTSKTMTTPSDEMTRQQPFSDLKRFQNHEHFAKARFEHKLYRSS